METTGNFLYNEILLGHLLNQRLLTELLHKENTNHETSCTTVVLPARQNQCYAYYLLKKFNNQEVVPVRVACIGVEF